MHGGYDFPGFGVNISSTASSHCLPADLQFHVDRQDAWPANITSFDRDFIIISEFSETEGPRPLIVIPNDGAGAFDTNSFALRIMAVDYQNQERGSFSIAEDTQLFLSDESERLHAYVHHFTLYDMQARGYVRPLCMSYLSHSKRKLTDNFMHFIDEFSKVSKYFKFGNRVVFSKDLEEHMLYLVDKQEELTLNVKEGGGVYENDYELMEAQRELEDLWEEALSMIRTLKLNVHDAKLKDTLHKLEDLAIRGCRPTLNPTKSSSDFNIQTNGLKETVTLRKTRSLPDIKKQCDCERRNSVLRQAMVDKVKKLHTKTLRSIHELCEWGAREAINRLRSIHKFYNRDALVIKIGREESSLLSPASSVLTIGRNFVSNLMSNVDLSNSHLMDRKIFHVGEYPNHPERQISTSSIASMYSMDSFESCLDDEIIFSAKSSVERDALFSPFTNLHAGHLELESDADEVGHHTGSSESFDVVEFSDLKAIEDKLQLSCSLDEQNMLLDTSSSARSASSLDRTKSFSTGNLSKNEFIHDFLTTKDAENARSSMSATAVLEGHKEVLKPTGRVKVFRHGLHHVVKIGKHKAKQYFKEHLPKGGQQFGSYLTVPQRERSDSHANPKLARSRSLANMAAIQCYADQDFELLEACPGANVLLFRHWFNNGIHLLYALMSGRPVVVLAEAAHEKKARALVTALWLFVPGHSSQQKVILWHKKRLQTEDLSRFKLIGLEKSKKNMIPANLKQHVSIVDYESGSFWTPKYEGTFLHMIFENKKQFNSNATYMAFLHSMFLELAAKVFVFYYVHCLGLSSCGLGYSTVSRGPIKEDVIDIMRKINVFHCDVKIVQYLSEVIKQKQLTNYKPLTDMMEAGTTDGNVVQVEGVEVPHLVLDFCSVVHYKNSGSS